MILESLFGFEVRFKLLSKKHYTILNNIDISSDDGEILHIDYVIVSQYGIFVIKILDIDGIIYGNDDDVLWKQVLGRQETTFKNPIKDLNKYINKLLSMEKTKLRKVNFVPIVVIKKAQFNIISGSVKIISPSNLIPVIKNYSINSIPNKYILDIIDQINSTNINSAE